jgi:hypothetical protein
LDARHRAVVIMEFGLFLPAGVPSRRVAMEFASPLILEFRQS